MALIKFWNISIPLTLSLGVPRIIANSFLPPADISSSDRGISETIQYLTQNRSSHFSSNMGLFDILFLNKDQHKCSTSVLAAERGATERIIQDFEELSCKVFLYCNQFNFAWKNHFPVGSNCEEAGRKKSSETQNLVVNHDESRDIDNIDFPNGFHAQLRVFQHFNFLNAILSNKVKQSKNDHLEITFARFAAWPPIEPK
jgi:hypothetical protein